MVVEAEVKQAFASLLQACNTLVVMCYKICIRSVLEKQPQNVSRLHQY